MAKVLPSRKPRKPVQSRGPGAARFSVGVGEKPCSAKPRRTARVDFSSEPGIAADQILWANGTPGIELVPNGMFVEGADLLDEDGVECSFEDVADNTDEDSVIAVIDARRAKSFVAFSGDTEDLPDEPIRINRIDVLEATVRRPYMDNDDVKAEEVPEDGDCAGMVVPYRCNRTRDEPTRKPKNASWKEVRSRQFQIGPDADERRAHRRSVHDAGIMRIFASAAMCATDHDDMEQ